MNRISLRLLFAVLLAAVSSSTFADQTELVVLKTDFEKDGVGFDAADYTIVDDLSFRGSRSLMGEVNQPNKALFIEVPFEGKVGHKIDVSLMARSDGGSTCALFWRVDKTKTPIARLKNVPTKKWTHVSGSYEFERNEKGIIQIAVPSSFNGKVGKAWVDELLITESAASIDDQWPENVVDFPALTQDEAGTMWLATLERPKLGRAICVYRLDGKNRQRVASFESPDITGVGAPAVAGLDDGCFLVFPIEQNDRWRLAYAFVNSSSPGKPSYKIIDSGGTANISPATAVIDNRACVLWESNASGRRGIMSCWVDEKGAGKVRQISERDVNSYNPSIVALDNGTLFAAWDSARNQSLDIYGAEWTKGKWQPERRITSDVRIERYPFLAATGNDVWMAWQAQSYQSISVNSISEQGIVVAKIGTKGLEAPAGFFELFEKGKDKLLRPRISFDPEGRLWLTARESGGQNKGWRSLFWVYTGNKWSDRKYLDERIGRWRPASMLWNGGNGFAAVQFDDVPNNREQQGINEDWNSDVRIVELPEVALAGGNPLETEALEMPESEFSLPAAMDMVAADFPRQKMKHDGETLSLFWGDLHAHTDLSICGRHWNQPGHDLFANRRDIEKLDFCALTDHGYDFDNYRWAYNGEQTRNNHDPGHFIAFLGQEWTSSKNPPYEGGIHNLYGHRNLIYEDPYYHKFHDSFDGNISPTELWKRLEGVEFVTIPHQLADWKRKGKGNPPTDWTEHDEHHQPVAEIFQGRGSYEYFGCPRQASEGAPFSGSYLQDAWAKGIVIGTIASPDHGGGKGKAGVWAKEMTRESILAAIRARHTFGTSGAKMLMRLTAEFKGGKAIMGDKIARPKGEIKFAVKGGSLRNIREMVIFRNNEAVFETQIGKKEFSLNWTDEDPPDEDSLWYYARFQAVDEELAWSSPIWFVKE